MIRKTASTVEVAAKRSTTRSGETIGALDYLAPVYTHLTRSMCQEAFAKIRTVERQRKWTLHALIWFWIGLLQGRFTSQTRALLQARSGHPLLPTVDASPEAFFQKIQAVRPAFFRRLFHSFTSKVEPDYRSNFSHTLPNSCLQFTGVYAIDGSRLAKVGRLLKVTRKVTKAIIPGAMEALYDLRRGFLKDLWFDPSGHASEIKMMNHIRSGLTQGCLLIADRMYALPYVWRIMKEQGVWMITRHNPVVLFHKKERLGKWRGNKVQVDEWLVEMGGSAGTEPVPIRMIRIWSSRHQVTLLTNILDSKRLSALDVARIYRQRWSIERMYLAMKEVLDLNRLHNSSPAAVGQQVYATAILYNALRLAQSQIAHVSSLSASRLSEQRLFPVLIENFIKMTYMHVGAHRAFIQMQASNPNHQLVYPCFELDHPTLAICPDEFIVEPRKGKRRRRRYCPGRVGHTAFGKIPGTKKYVAY